MITKSSKEKIGSFIHAYLYDMKDGGLNTKNEEYFIAKVYQLEMIKYMNKDFWDKDLITQNDYLKNVDIIAHLIKSIEDRKK